MRRLCGLALVLALALACERPARRPRLTLYCSAHIEWCELLRHRFEADTGVSVSMIRKSTGEMYAQVWAERRNPRGDVWFAGTGDTHIQAAEAGLTETYRSPLLSSQHKWAVDPAGRGEHRTTGVYMGALGFGYNEEWLAKKGIDPPTGWADLIRPELRGEIQIANPSSSGTAYSVLATLVQLWGEDEAFAYLAKLHLNVSQYTKSGAAPVRAAGRGEAGVGVVFLHDAVRQKKAGFPIRLVAPWEGTGYEIGCVSLIRGARHPDEARRFIDYVLGPAGQGLMGQAEAFQIPSNVNVPIPDDAPRMEDMKLIDFDFSRFGTKRERERLLTRFEREVRALPR